MGFDKTNMELSPSTIKEDNFLREHFKLMLNCGIGKFGQHHETSETHFAQSQVNKILF